jgi:hypothetical protein
MTIRETLGDAAAAVQRRLDQVLDSEDAIIVLVDRRGATSFYKGFGASGCQLELLGCQLEAALRPFEPASTRDAAGREAQ